jgi:hypothetical protein
MKYDELNIEQKIKLFELTLQVNKYNLGTETYHNESELIKVMVKKSVAIFENMALPA